MTAMSSEHTPWPRRFSDQHRGPLGHIEADTAKKPEIHEARERAPRDFVGDAAPRDNVAASNFATLGSDPEHLVLQPAKLCFRHRHPLAPGRAWLPRTPADRPTGRPDLPARSDRRP